MRIIKRVAIFGVSLRLLCTGTEAGIGVEDFSTIARKNAFRLSPPEPEPKPEVVQTELSHVRLRGLTTLPGSRQAILTISKKTKAAATEVSCILGEGDTRDRVKVLRIDMHSGTVWLTNHGVEQVLTIKRLLQF